MAESNVWALWKLRQKIQPALTRRGYITESLYYWASLKEAINLHKGSNSIRKSQGMNVIGQKTQHFKWHLMTIDPNCRLYNKSEQNIEKLLRLTDFWIMFSLTNHKISKRDLTLHITYEANKGILAVWCLMLAAFIFNLIFSLIVCLLIFCILLHTNLFNILNL